ncbi:MAG: hypothetical protein ACRC0Y_08930 [Fusobacteriaceae bacterium]
MKNYVESNSVATSLGNIGKLPSGLKKLATKGFKKVFNYGAGLGHKFHQQAILELGYEMELVNFDPFIPEISTIPNLEGCEVITCNNVLNVIKDDAILENVLNELESFGLAVHITIYEGNKSGDGKLTNKNTYQRNMKAVDYKLEERGYILRGGVWIKPAAPTMKSEAIEELEYHNGIVVKEKHVVFCCHEYNAKNLQDLIDIAEMVSVEQEFEGETFEIILERLRKAYSFDEKPLKEKIKETTENEKIWELFLELKIGRAENIALEKNYEFWTVLHSEEFNEVYLFGNKEAETAEIIDVGTEKDYDFPRIEKNLVKTHEEIENLLKEGFIRSDFTRLQNGTYIK